MNCRKIYSALFGSDLRIIFNRSLICLYIMPQIYNENFENRKEKLQLNFSSNEAYARAILM